MENAVDDVTKVKMARALAFGERPHDLPAQYVEMFDKACHHVRNLHSNREPRPSDLWIISLLTETNLALLSRIEKLEGQLLGSSNVKVPDKMKVKVA